MVTITYGMRFRLLLINYADKYGVSKIAVKYKINRQYITLQYGNKPWLS